MSILAILDSQIRAAADNQAPGPLNDFWYGPVEGSETDAGIRITPRQAMLMSAVFKCVRWRAEQFAKLPKKVYERIEQMGRPGRAEAPNHPLYKLLHTAPNPLMPSFLFHALISRDLDLEGNFYAFIQRDETIRRNIIGLWRFMPERTDAGVRMVSDATAPMGQRPELIYTVYDDNGKPYPFYADEMLHIRSFTSSNGGITGDSPIKLNTNLVAWKRAAQRNSAQFFKKGSRPSMIVTIPHVIKDPKAKAAVVASLTQSGRDAGAVALIEGGQAQVTKWSIDPDEAQHLETMKYQDVDLCGIMNVKPHKVGIMDFMTNNNVEQQNIEAVTDCIQPLCEMVESWMEFALLSDRPSTGIGGGTELDRYFIECELKGMMRGDSKARAEFYQVLRNLGVMSGNDIAYEENMPPYEGGEIRVMNSAFATLQRIEDGTAVQPKQQQEPTNPADKQRQDTQKNNQGAQAAHAKLTFEPIFTDAVSRIANRKRPEDRETAAAKTFYSIFLALSRALNWEAPTEFVTDYLGALTQRVRSWDVAVTQQHANDELDRAINAIAEKKGQHNA